jgi:hypothetical protein
VIHPDGERLPFVDLSPGSDAAEIRQAIERVLTRGWFILGPEVEAFEVEFAVACGTKHAVGVANGTDAIALALRAAGVKPGDEVIVPAMTAAFTGLAVVAAGAIPVMADVDPRTLTLDARACADAITPRTRAIVPVHLYGQAADMLEIMTVADRHRLVVIEDCCQAHMATCNGLPVGTIGAAGAFSFYPTKNLGALGDGGAVITSDGALADRVRLLRNGGQTNRNLHAVAGVNSRLDELQAAILRVRLPNLPPENGPAAPACGVLPGRPDRRGRAGRGTRSGSRLPSVSCTIGQTRGAAGPPGPRRRGDVDPLSHSAAQAAGVRAPGPARVSRRRQSRRGAAVAAAPRAPARPAGREGCRRHPGFRERIDRRVKALLTGGAGFIGSHLAERLLELGHEVQVLDNLSTGSIDNIAHLKGRPGSRTSSTR